MVYECMNHKMPKPVKIQWRSEGKGVVRIRKPDYHPSHQPIIA
jgi:hypothetical protein